MGGIIGGVFDEAQRRVGAAWEWLFDPLWQWYAVGILIFLACVVIAYFLPFKWIRAGLGAFLLLVGAYIAGGRHMRGTFKNKLEEEREKRKALENQQRQSGGSNGGGWFDWR